MKGWLRSGLLLLAAAIAWENYRGPASRLL